LTLSAVVLLSSDADNLLAFLLSHVAIVAVVVYGGSIRAGTEGPRGGPAKADTTQ
jgi:hypothetical protein